MAADWIVGKGPFASVCGGRDGIKCKEVAEITAELKKKPALANKVYPIKIIWYETNVTTVDNRRLKAHREARVPVRYLKTSWVPL
ncbi:MAG: hypothetical protein M3Y57_05890 [Acidobacteriota bacterium]|nr:hypothetical protein [Acidobacteriota bacterium]